MPDPRETGSDRLISSFIERELRSGKIPNRLIGEKSPYLLQHAFNPVDWHPWGPDAFERARGENRVIFLSIGYSTCYWCHVMEREVFERPEIAALMNGIAVNIKVDREERPDVDRVYMAAVQAMTGSGGWPMSVFLTPDLKPFFGATYIPPATSGGRPGFPEILRRIADTWSKEPDRILEAGERLVEFIRGLESPAAGGPDGVDAAALADAAFGLFQSAYDPLHAGFGRGPKFPRPAAIDFLLAYHRGNGRAEALEMASATLGGMASGGMYDHVGGGFHRYSVDGEWRVPHFEKMLYDQAQLACSYLSAYQSTGDPSFAKIVTSVLGYVKRDLRGSHGGFYSAEDAESATDPTRPNEKLEGAFYLWTTAEVEAVLGPERGGFFARHFGMRDSGNALHDPHGLFAGRNILYVAEEPGRTAGSPGPAPGLPDAQLLASLETLRRARAERPRPILDDKVICAWNGLAISAFARSGRILGSREDLDVARAAASFALENLFDRVTGTLRRRFRDGEARYDGGLQDYAFLVAGLLDLYEACFDPDILRDAIALTRAMVRLFRDPAGGFFDTPGDDASIIVRTREDYDGAEPSGNAVAAVNLWRLSVLTDDRPWREMAEAAAAAVAARVEGRPDAAPAAITALGLIRGGGLELVVAGAPGADDTSALLHEANRRYLPGMVVMLADGGRNQAFLGERLPFLGAMGPQDGRATAYLCRNYACELPVTDPARLGELLDRAAAVHRNPAAGK
jgi:uncharacterized protein YyaL (SSP411 family)